MGYVIAVGDENEWHGQWTSEGNYLDFEKKLWNDLVNNNKLDEIFEQVRQDKLITEVNPDYIQFRRTGNEPVFESNKGGKGRSDNHVFTRRVYIINPFEKTLTILAGTGNAGNKEFRLVDKYNLQESEPNWEKVDVLSDLISDEIEDKKKIKRYYRE